MLKFIPATAAVALAVVLAVASTGGAQGQGNTAQDRTIVLYEKEETTSFRFVDAKPFTRFTSNGPRRISPGDALVLGIPLFTDAALSQGAGRQRVHCVATNGSRRFTRVTYLCDGAYSFRDGTLLVSGVFKAKEGAQVIKIAVVGGTDAYEGARGSVTINDPAQGNSTQTIHLLAQ